MKARITAALLACAMFGTTVAQAASADDTAKQPPAKSSCRKDGTTGLMFAVNPSYYPYAHVAESDVDKFCSNTTPINMFYKKTNGVCLASMDFGKRLYHQILVPCEKVEKFVQAAK